MQRSTAKLLLNRLPAARPSTLPILRRTQPILLRPSTPPCTCFSTSSTRRNSVQIAQYHIGQVSTQEYHSSSEKAMDSLTEYLEELVEDLGDSTGYDVEYSAGVLTLNLGDKGTYVINKQPPNKQIWLSSPISGPKRYDFDSNHKVWFYSRDGSTMKGLLDFELSSSLERKVDVDLGQRE